MNKAIATDAFNLLCGRKLGSGIHRDVFECKLRPELVVKVETETNYRDFANVREMKFWNDYQHMPAVKKWLAPCHFLSPDGRILLQERVQPILREEDVPEMLPAFITDIKPENFGMLNGQFVCVDYALVVINPVTRLRKW